MAPAHWIFALAPMEGVTDDVVRSLITAWGGVDYCVTEFIRVSDAPLSERVLRRECPELDRGARTLAGVPVHVQLLGGDPGRLAETARIAAACGASVIDLNFGCPAPTVNRHDGGASLLRDPCRVENVTAAVRRAVPASVSVSAKVRLGWSDPDDVVAIARAAEAGGAAWLTVHGRTRMQGYAPPVDWVRIGVARESVTIPVVANGDLRTPEDVLRCHEITGCDRFMIGRAAIERPEVYRVLRGVDAWWSPRARVAVLETYAQAALGHGGWTTHGALCRVKQWARALAQGDASLGAVYDRIKRSASLDEAREHVRRFVAEGENVDAAVSNARPAA